MTKNIRHNGRDLQLRELADDILKGLPADALVASILVNVVIVFINSWMVQMVFTNRYGKSSWTNITFSFIDMAIVLYMSNAFAATFDRHLATFFTAAGLLSLTLCLQYLIVYHQATNHVDQQIVRAFSGILGLRTVTLLIGGDSSPTPWGLPWPWPGSSSVGSSPVSPASTSGTGRLSSPTCWNG